MELTLNDGTVLKRSYAMISSGLMMVYIQDENSTMRSVFDTLIDPVKTVVVHSVDYMGTETVISGYTKLIDVRDEGNGLITAVLSKAGEV